MIHQGSVTAKIILTILFDKSGRIIEYSRQNIILPESDYVYGR